jgi:hypothetical protein
VRPLPKPLPASYTTRIQLKPGDANRKIYRNLDHGRRLTDEVELSPKSNGTLGWRYNVFRSKGKRTIRICVVFGTAKGGEAVFGFIHVNQMVRGQRPWKGAYVKR